MRRWVGFAIGGILLASVVAVGSATTGCYGRECEPEAAPKQSVPFGGRMVDPNTWESNPIDGEWLDYRGQRIWDLRTELLGNRVPYEILVYISAQQHPATDYGGSSTLGAGNVVDIRWVHADSVGIANNTCAQYYARVVVRASPVVASTDASTDGGDASTLVDASADSSVPNDATND